MNVYTRKGDDGTTGLFYGGRARKDSPRVCAVGAVDEAQAAIGVARAEAERGSDLDDALVAVERDLWVLMAELATDEANQHKLAPGESLVTPEMVTALEGRIDEIGSRFEALTEFVVPGQDRTSALLDLARAVTRRAERATLPVVGEGSSALAYLNRLSDLLWSLARWQEGLSLTARDA